MRIAVIGAGIVGLAAAYELDRAGEEVRCYEQAQPLAARSVGDTRIFRHLHQRPAMVELARRSRERWRRWERQAGGQHFLGDEGTVVSKPPAEARRWAEAMRTVGVACELLEGGEVVDRLPVAAPAGLHLWDPGGGVIGARRTGEFLRDSVAASIVPAAVHSVDPRGSGARLHTSDGHWDCDSVLVAAGAGTAWLAEGAGLAVPAGRVHHARFTFRLRDPGRVPPCWIDDSEGWRDGFTTYGHLAGDGRWAVGGNWDEHETRWELGSDAVTERSRELVTAYVSEYLDGVDPEVADVVRCDHISGAGAGDGFDAARSGAILAFWGDNLFKFAPLLGALLSEGARSLSLPAELHQPPG